MKVEDYVCSINGRRISFDDFLMELRKQCRTERAYIGAKKRLFEELEKGSYGWNSTAKVHLRISKKRRICPLCKKEIVGYPALSRKDNKTEICSNCGTKEALEDFVKHKDREEKRNG